MEFMKCLEDISGIMPSHGIVSRQSEECSHKKSNGQPDFRLKMWEAQFFKLMKGLKERIHKASISLGRMWPPLHDRGGGSWGSRSTNPTGPILSVLQ